MAEKGSIRFSDWLLNYYIGTQKESIGKLRADDLHLQQYVFCAGCCKIQESWILGKVARDVDAETLARNIDRSLPSDMRQILDKEE